jgi:uncharacterized protein YbjT (DUF2867 family)
MSDSKVIAVVGATGHQGGGLARAILADPDGGFACRALTRNPSSDAARALADAGAEVVRVDLDDPASVDAAFAGAYGAFCVTFFWEHFSVDREQAEARTMAAAAAKAGLRHVIWSTLEDTRQLVPLDDDRMPTLQGRFKVPHYDGKGEINHVFTDAGVPTTFLQTSFYWENYILFGMGPQRGPDGKLAITMPLGDAKLPSMASEDIGRCAYGIFKAGDRYIGETVSIAGEHVSVAEMVAAFSRALGEEVVYNDVPPEVFRGFGFPGADDIGNMFQFKRDFEAEYRAPRDVSATRALNPQLQTFESWLAEHLSEIPIEARA